MGRAKNDEIACAERGYSHSEKYVCAECFGDAYLKEHIRKKGNRGICSFCKGSGVRKVLPLEEVMPLIMQVVRKDYMPALDYAMYDSETKTYMENVFEPYDFVVDELNQYLQCEEEELIFELIHILNCEDRVSVYNWIARQEEEDMHEWESFCDLVKESKLSAEQIVSECVKERATEPLLEIKKCLDKLLDYVVESTSLTSIIRPHTTIFRCGTHIQKTYMQDYGVSAIPATLLGTAPALMTANNRMSEKGDMMFYGAFQEEVAVAEIKVQAGDTVTVGKFHTNKQIKVLDFSAFTYRSCPSIFDMKKRDQRSQWFFINAFVEEISKRADKKEEQFYKPTQVFTKYIQRRTNLSGMIYPSSEFRIHREQGKMEMKKCIVLFVENRDCIEVDDQTDKSRVQLIMEPEPKQYICGLESS